MQYDNLWDIPSTDDIGSSTENIIEIMRQQGQYLKISTEGKVWVKFRRIKNIMSSIESLAMIQSLELIEGEKAGQLEDANSLYRTHKYGFEIYNYFYKFRILEMNLSPLYPVSVFLDEGVLQDTKDKLCNKIEKGSMENEFIIKSDRELLESLKIVFSSKKVKYILYKLQQNSNCK